MRPGAFSLQVSVRDPGTLFAVAPAPGFPSAPTSGTHQVTWTPTRPESVDLVVIVTDDGNGLSDTWLVRVQVSADLSVSISNAPTAVEIDESASISVSVQGGTGPFEVSVFDDRADFAEFLVVDTEGAFTLPVVFTRVGPHRITVEVTDSSEPPARGSASVAIHVGTRTFTIVSVEFPSSIPINSSAALSATWSGDPIFPVTMHLRQRPGGCPAGFNCVNPSMTFEGPANPLVFPGAIFCTGGLAEPVFFDYEVVLADATGLETPPVPAGVTCRPE